MASAFFALKIIRRNRQARQRKHAEQIFKENPFKTPSYVNRTCRICLKEGTIPIYGDKNHSDISESVQTFGDIDLSKDEDLPKYLCEECHILLQNAILFRKSAKESDALLRQRSQELDIVSSSNEIVYSDNDSKSNNYEYEVETQKSYSCKLCKISFKSNDELIAHKNSKQHKNIRIQCPICYRLLTSHLFKRHMVRHDSASHLICEVCGKMYRKDNLIRHLQLHSFELPFQCQICPYRGRYVDSLKIHMRSHTGDKPFHCDKCQLRFLTRSNLNRHLLTHKKDRPFKCNECTRGFYTMRDLEVHFKSDHAGIKEFGCRMCGNKYGSRKALMRHELRVHKRDKMSKGRLPLYLQAEYRKDMVDSS